MCDLTRDPRPTAGLCLAVGLTDEQLVHLAKLGRDAAKTSTRDLPLVCAQGRTGATTVSATMALAARAGVRVFVTGGIGGVHRGAEQSFDISCDLTELGRTPVAVICAGAKSILDVPKTLEVLETNGVPVVTFGADQFPAFFTRDSGVRSPARVDDARQCGEMLRAMDALGMQSGALFAVPVPQEHEAGAEKVERATQQVRTAAGAKRGSEASMRLACRCVCGRPRPQHICLLTGHAPRFRLQALAEAERLGVRGAETTPFVLKHVAEETGGDSLKVRRQADSHAMHGALEGLVGLTRPISTGGRRADTLRPTWRW